MLKEIQNKLKQIKTVKNLSINDIFTTEEYEFIKNYITYFDETVENPFNVQFR